MTMTCLEITVCGHLELILAVNSVKHSAVFLGFKHTK